MVQPSYYAVIPADVRYNPDLCANAKLLYGEITALCNSQGYCWANNRYFARLYGVDERTVRRWLEQLEELGFIVRDISMKDEDGTVYRKIYLKMAAPEEPDESADKNVRGVGQKCPGGPDKNVRYNNTFNNTSNIYSACARVTEKKKKSKGFNDFNQRNYDYDALEAVMFKRPREGGTG